ncbi:MAG: Chromosomal replication initiator protein DnaA [Parcubacteria group bacterium GW2011_GWA2_39_18]|nr:MAG: Chromosomal replication initiator protein DnaA [Parcubacteria group bacterium GW2011_GWA2_39_18]
MSCEQIWQMVLSELELIMPESSFQTWFQNTSIKSFSGGLATISVPNIFTKSWLEKKYSKEILNILKNLDCDAREIEYVIDYSPKSSAYKNSSKKAKASSSKSLGHVGDEDLKLPGLNIDAKTGLNPRYAFDNFVVGSFNELAHAAVSASVQNLGVSYNPLFIYGDVGLGKTHLIQAAGNEIKSLYPNLSILYVQAEKFTNDLVHSLQHHKMDDFKEKYRNIDVFIIDDIQFIARKEQTQIELFYTFNTLYEKNKQIILSSDRPPRAIPELEDRLRSRFEGGMIADIGAPNLETRIAILKEKLIQKNTSLDDEIVNHIAKNFENNIRELEGALTRVLGLIKMTNTLPSVEIVSKWLLSTSSQSNKNISSKNILEAVSVFYDIDEKLILSKSRRQEIVKARQVSMYLLREILRLSLPSIGQKIGNKDHSTVIHAIGKIENGLKKDENLIEEIKKIKQKLYK